MPYSPPTLADLREKVARDLRDPNLNAFSAEDILDFINFGIGEVNRIRPVEEVYEADVDDIEQTDYDLDLTLVWRVEVWRDGQYLTRITPNEGDKSIGGWEYYAQTLSIPDFRNVLNTDTDILRVWGYRNRSTAGAEDEALELVDIDEEHAVRAYAGVLGYQRLMADRSLFQQWQTQANNTDVSPNQLTGMLGVRQSEWDELRRRIKRLVRTA